MQEAAGRLVGIAKQIIQKAHAVCHYEVGIFCRIAVQRGQRDNGLRGSFGGTEAAGFKLRRKPGHRPLDCLCHAVF